MFEYEPVNFVKKVTEWSKNKNELRTAEDEVSAPTYELIKLRAYGTYHLTNTPCSRYKWAEYILNLIGWNGELKKAKQEEFKLPAKRPKYSVLDNYGYKETRGKEMRDWREVTKEHIEYLKSGGLI